MDFYAPALGSIDCLEKSYPAICQWGFTEEVEVFAFENRVQQALPVIWEFYLSSLTCEFDILYLKLDTVVVLLYGMQDCS